MAPPVDRRLEWDGCFNVRDLGGHVTLGGRRTRFGVVARSDARERLTEGGWASLRAHGVSTIVDLRDPSEHGRGFASLPGVELVEIPILDLGDDEFWGDGRWRGNEHSRDFYVAVLERWPGRFAAAVARVADAGAGAILVHCQAGRDRTGLLVAALLTLVGVGPESIAEDYAASEASLQPLYDEWMRDASDERQRARIRRANTSDPEVMLGVLASVDLPELLLSQGLTLEDVAKLRARLVES